MASTPREAKQALLLVGLRNVLKGQNNWSSWNYKRYTFYKVNQEFSSVTANILFFLLLLSHLGPSPTSADNLDPSIPSIRLLQCHPSPLSPYGKLQGPRRDHHSAARRRDARSCQTQGGLSVREDQSPCKPLRHSTPPAGTLCLQPFCLA